MSKETSLTSISHIEIHRLLGVLFGVTDGVFDKGAEGQSVGNNS
jgi:hypothetical protein